MTEDTIDHPSVIWCKDRRKKGWNESSGKIQWLNVLVRCSGLLDKPGLDLRKLLHIPNSPLDIPYMVRINHKHIPVGPTFFPSVLLALGGFLPLGRVAGCTMADCMTSPRWRPDSMLEPTFTLKWLKP